jgi:hypothetical protein
MSALDINFDKSEAIVTWVTVDDKRKIVNLLNWKLGKFPMKYLGLPTSDMALRVSYRDILPYKMGHRVDPW